VTIGVAREAVQGAIDRANRDSLRDVNLDVEFQPGAPLRRQLEHSLRLAIRSGRLQPGTPLPPSRALAEQLGVSRGVVVDSYGQLVAEGYLSARQGSGTRVARLPEHWAPPERRLVKASVAFRYDLRPGTADFHAFPRSRWQAALTRALQDLPDRRLSYGSHRGAAELRNAVAEHLARLRGVVVDPERIVVCLGASHGLSIIWRALRARGARRVAIEDPSWRWQRLTVEHAGLETVPVRVDQDGLVVSDLAAADVDAVVVTPAHQYPTGVVMSAERRRALVTWARERGALIVEDDYDAEYRFDRDPVSALQGLAPDRVAFVGTTSKTLAPALRLGWVVPPASLVDDVERELLVTGVTAPTVEQLALASFISDSGLERHLRRMRTRYAAKRELLIESLERWLPETELSGISAGLHVLVWLPPGVDEAGTAARAREAGVGVHELHRHCTTVAPLPGAFVVGFALPSESEIRTGVRLLGEAATRRSGLASRSTARLARGDPSVRR
jgi:GntR family transcriptional regulator / MocR family aminotransferase